MTSIVVTDDDNNSKNATATPLLKYDYDMVVIGGGSGGVSTAKRCAVLYNKKVAVIESGRWGGTCVNVGCVPKKIMYQTAHIFETVKHDTKHYRIRTTTNTGTGNSGGGGDEEDNDNDGITFDWLALKEKRDKYIIRLNNIYLNGLKNSGVTVLEGWGSFIDDHTIQIANADGSSTTITTESVLIAVGGKPHVPPTGHIENDMSIVQHSITSDGFFELETQPKVAAVVGAGYIAVELAGVLATLGTETHLILRYDNALRTFDHDIMKFLNDIMKHHTPNLHVHINTGGVSKLEVDTTTNKKKLYTINNPTDCLLDHLDIVLMAPGRIPNIDGLKLDSTQIKIHERNRTIIVDEYQNTSVPNIYALGDVCGQIELTPMAIAAGRRLADRLYSPDRETYQYAKTSYENVPTVVFSHPPIGTIGLTEQEATKQYGVDNIVVYRSTFVNLYYSMYDMEPNEKPKTFMKIICLKTQNEKVIGLHLIGKDVDEILQGFGVAMKMGATKADFDSCIAIHPTAAEEVVTMGTWGTSPQVSGAIESPLFNSKM